MRSIFIFFVFIILFTTCRKKQPEKLSPSDQVISESLYPFLFNTGSHWVYRNEALGTLDSTIVTSIIRWQHQGYAKSEVFTINYVSFPGNKQLREDMTGYVISKGVDSLAGFTLLSSKRKGDKSNNAEIENVFDSLAVEGTTYKTVVKMKIKKARGIYTDCNYYYVDNVGVIKKEIIINDTIKDTWNLVRKKVVMLPYQL